jgi:hypothetical protein
VLLTQAAQARIVSRIARITCHQPSRQIYLDDVPLELTTKEYEIMARLVQCLGIGSVAGATPAALQNALLDTSRRAASIAPCLNGHLV